MILPVGGHGHHDFGDFFHRKEGFEAVAVNGLAAQNHKLLGNVSAHALTETPRREHRRKFAFKIQHKTFRRNIFASFPN